MTPIDTQGHVLYALRNATIQKWPFPHFFVENVFPRKVYHAILDKLRVKTDFEAGKQNYHGRRFGSTDEFPELGFMNTTDFMVNVAKIFQNELNKRFAGRDHDQCGIYHDLRLVRDGEGYYIGPHTDAAWKIVSLLFYMPQSDNMFHRPEETEGTSIYLPKDPNFRCPGGPHHKFDGFDRIYTAPYLPNSCFGFFKTDNSFHGVEPITRPMIRDVLLYNVYDDFVHKKVHSPKS